MNIIYGVSGDNYGHSSRAKIIIEHLEKEGHKVFVIAYGKSCEILSPLFKTLKIDGICLHFKENSLSLSRSFMRNLPAIAKNIWNAKEIHKKISEFNPDLAITDFEPITAMLSYKLKIPLIAIDNQHLITHTKFSYPKKYLKSYLLTKLAIKTYIPSYDYLLILSFIKNKINKKNIYFISPIIRKEILKLKNKKEKNQIIVYLNNPNHSFLEILKKINENFVVYGFNKQGKDKNLFFKKISPNFIKDLASSKAVISTAGFSLLSESVYLKKPFFAIPLRGQFEQTFNALLIKRIGIGDFSENLNEEQIENFIKNLKKYKKNMNKIKINPEDMKKVLDKILIQIKKS